MNDVRTKQCALFNLVVRLSSHLPQLHRPFCQPFGNRRLVHCRDPSLHSTLDSSDTSTDDNTHTDTSSPNTRPHYAQRPPSPPLNEGSGAIHDDIILAWEPCGRVVSTERADFFEFAAVNLLFVCVSIGVVIWRSRRMRLQHARQLAARIGMVGWRR